MIRQFQLVSNFKPTGDQPKAIAELSKNIADGVKHQTLLGVTGSGKTFTMSNVIEKLQKPALVISPNKTLAAQLYQEFREFFPKNSVHYFVSYYDYYQPEAYIPQTNTYIEKDAKVNEIIDRMRHEAVQELSLRKDVIVVASVSCIYGLGSPQEYQHTALQIKSGDHMTRRDFLSHLTLLQYQRDDEKFEPGTFRIRGNIVEVYLVTGKEVLKVEFEGSIIARIEGPRTIYPAKFWVTSQDKLKLAMGNIKIELQETLKILKKQNKLLEAERLEQRTNFDLEMMSEAGYCHGIENYSRHLEFRKPGTPPFTLIDYFGKDFLLFIDESHQTLPQIRAMALQDRARKEVLIKHGFRLPSALDNRPLTFLEFEERAKQKTYVSATPGYEEQEKSGAHIVEQLVRPTGLLEPSIEIRKTKNQVQDLIEEIKKRREKNERVLALTLTKRLAEELSRHLEEQGISSQWLHSEIKTLERPGILEGLRKGTYDVLVGINLLREGLDLPEVSLVAILDADQEGFLRSETTLVQTMGRASRHLTGHVILYADKLTGSLKSAIREIDRRRDIQEQYNKTHGITPTAIIKAFRKWEFSKKSLAGQAKEVEEEFSVVHDIKLLENEMKQAASCLDFERAAQLRDLIKKFKNGTSTPYANYRISKKSASTKRKKEGPESQG